MKYNISLINSIVLYISFILFYKIKNLINNNNNKYNLKHF